MATDEIESVFGESLEEEAETRQEDAEEVATEEAADVDGEALAEIKAAREMVRKMEAAYFVAKEDAKAAKGSWEDAVANLTATIDRVTRPLPLFDQPADRPPVEQQQRPPVEQLQGPLFDRPTSENAWREHELEELAIPGGVLGKLYDAGIETIGELEDLRAKIANGKADWPKGVGEAKVTVIENAVVEWLAKWHAERG